MKPSRFRHGDPGGSELTEAADLPRRVIGFGLLGIAGGALALLVTGSPLLSAAAPAGMPLGNIAAAISMAAPPAAVFLISKARRVRMPSLVLSIAAAAWLPASVMLAGNAELVFSDETRARFDAWVVATGMITLADLALLACFVLGRGRRQ